MTNSPQVPPPLASRSRPTPTADVALSEVLGALSYALDLTEGQRPGHTLRTCVIGMRLGKELGLGTQDLTALYFALLLKDAGCSSNAARMAALFGTDDRAVKYGMKLVDWHAKAALAMATWRSSGVGRGLRARTRHFLTVARTENATRDFMAVRCDRGASIALRLGFPAETAAAIRSLDEHWNGRGYAEGLSGERIPLLARIANLAQVAEAFYGNGGVDAAVGVVRARRGRWFDPTLSWMVISWRRDHRWWARLADESSLGEMVRALEPGTRALRVDDDGLDNVARAFADIIDAKSPYTFRHSTNVARYAVGVGAELGLDAHAQRRLLRAGLLHDVGKLGVSNMVLDKTGALTPAERAEVERHPRFTWEILQRVKAFEGFARLASVHHERLDGRGYPWGIGGDELDTEARALCVADVYEALTADRPYRAGMAPADALSILRRDTPHRLCPEAVDAVEAFAARGQPMPVESRPDAPADRPGTEFRQMAS
jgi:HD-GYP domain-containing protein (c-di-GMP phosphodiesterase class II)